MKTKEPLRSEGARIERAAMRGYLRRRIIRNVTKTRSAAVAAELMQGLDWVLTREKRYGKRAGGL